MEDEKNSIYFFQQIVSDIEASGYSDILIKIKDEIKVLDKTNDKDKIKELKEKYKFINEEILGHILLKPFLKAKLDKIFISDYKIFNIKIEDLTDKEDIISFFNKIYQHRYIYTNRDQNIFDNTDFPKNQIEKENNYLSTADLTIDEKVDFKGNASLGSYYKFMILVESKKEDLRKNTFLEDISCGVYFENIFKVIENNYSKILTEVENHELKLDNPTQILVPYKDDYISITPASSISMLSIVNTKMKGLKIQRDNKSKELQKELNKLYKRKKKSDNDKQQIEKLIEEQNSIPHLYFDRWQSYISKKNNITLKASGLERIMRCEAPSYNYDVSKGILYKNNPNSFAKKIVLGTLKNLKEKELENEISVLYDNSQKDFHLNKWAKEATLKIIKKLVLKVEAQYKREYELLDIEKNFDTFILENRPIFFAELLDILEKYSKKGKNFIFSHKAKTEIFEDIYTKRSKK